MYNKGAAMSNANPYSIEKATIGTTVWNPTNEEFGMQYAGVSISLKPGERITLTTKCANHLLNNFGQRGLAQLVYGADEEMVKFDALERNLAFKKKQVVMYNQDNEMRKTRSLGYVPPSKKVKEYAIELGLKLLEPYAIREEERTAISKAETENKALKEKLAEQETEMAELRKMLQTVIDQTKPQETSPKTANAVQKGK